MTRAFIFWLLMFLWLLVALIAFWPMSYGSAFVWAPMGGSVLLFVLLGLLGWQVFGPPIKG